MVAFVLNNFAYYKYEKKDVYQKKQIGQNILILQIVHSHHLISDRYVHIINLFEQNNISSPLCMNMIDRIYL